MFSSKFLNAWLLITAAIPLGAQPPAGGRGPARSPFLISRPVPEQAAVDRGKAAFGAACGFCHGTNATGAEGPDLLRSAIALRDEGGDEIGPVIRNGRTGMPAFPQMTDAQIKDIAAFIRYRQQDAIDRGSYVLKNVNTGDAKSGETFFVAKCATCHTGAKSLAGVGAKYDSYTLMGKIVYPAGRGAAARSAVTVTAAGKATTGTLEYQDDFEIALRDASGEYHGFTRGPGVTVDIKDPLQGHAKLMKVFNDKDLHDVLAYVVTMK
jgi:cytochrome c oxidase cbb3-type subunit 3